MPYLKRSKGNRSLTFYFMPPSLTNRLLSKPFLQKAIGAILIIAFSLRLWMEFKGIIFENSMQAYSYTEYLINFAGGFVRRGLLGEGLLWFTSATGVYPRITINVICLVAFAFVVWFFFSQFRKGGYCWWLLLSPLVLGFVAAMIRKDFLLYCNVIAIFYLMRASGPALWKRALAFVLAALGLFLHEAFIFFGVPIYALILLSERKHLVVNALQVLVLLGIFGILCMHKGDTATAYAIIDSWNAVVDGNPLEFIRTNSIGALAWDTKETMLQHIKWNIGASDGSSFGLVYWPIFLVVAYYFFTFFFTVFKPTKAAYGKTEQTRLSSLFCTLLVCLVPMFTILSCDYGRIIQYATVTSLAAYLILDKSVIDRLLPRWLQRFVAGLNAAMARLVPPSKGLIAVLLLLTGVSPYWYNPTLSMIESPVGTIGYFAYMTLYKLLGII